MNGAMEFIHMKMLVGDGQLSGISFNVDSISFSPANQFFTLVSGKSKKVLKFVPTASVPEDPVMDLNSACEEPTNDNSVDTLPPMNEMAMPAERFAVLIEKSLESSFLCMKTMPTN